MANSASQRLAAWLETPHGLRLLREESEPLAQCARRFHGDTLLWVGSHEASTRTVRGCMVRNKLFASRLPGRAPEDLISLRCALESLPLRNNSIDAVVLHHALETADDPRSALREAARVVVPGGRLVICAFNPLSLWGVRGASGRLREDAFSGVRMVTTFRLLDWLALLGFELQADVRYLSYNMPVARRRADYTLGPGRVERTLHQLQPPIGGVYLVSVVKQAAAMRPRWRGGRVASRNMVPAAYPKSAVNRQPTKVLKLQDWKSLERGR